MVDIQALKNLGASWLNENPYRDDAAAIEVGRQAFVQACQRCHGPDALGKGPGPNLRRLSAYCKRIVNASLQRECFGDNNAYFVKSVLKGKTRVGVVHMPPWEGVLSQEVLWALKAYYGFTPRRRSGAAMMAASQVPRQGAEVNPASGPQGANKKARGPFQERRASNRAGALRRRQRLEPILGLLVQLEDPDGTALLEVVHALGHVTAPQGNGAAPNRRSRRSSAVLFPS